MARKVYYSFHYKLDKLRIQQVIQMGRVEGQKILTGQGWEEVERGGEKAIKKWIDDEMHGKSCIVVLVGAQTSLRPWVDYEIRKAWDENRGVVGIHIYGLKDLNTQQTSSKGSSPFTSISLKNGKRLSDIVALYDPPGWDSKAVYKSISDNIENLVEQAIKIRNAM